KTQKDRASGQTSMFAAFAATSAPQGPAATGNTAEESYPEVEEWSEKKKLRSEKEALGFYITGHPLDRYAEDLPRITSATTQSVGKYANPQARFAEVSVAGVISLYRERPLKSGKGRMAFITIEDLHGSIECLVFSKVFNECEDILRGD